MAKQLLIFTTDGHDYIMRLSDSPFTIGNGQVQGAGMEPINDESGFTQTSTNASVPGDWEPWRYRLPAFTKSDKHPDNVEQPVVVPKGRALNRAEFLDVGMETDVAVINNILKEMPLVTQYLEEFKDGGIQFEDAVQQDGPPTRIQKLFAAAKALSLLTDEVLAAFMNNWVVMFPAQ